MTVSFLYKSYHLTLSGLHSHDSIWTFLSWGLAIFGVPNITLLFFDLAFSWQDRGPNEKPPCYFHFDQHIIELKLNFSFKAHQSETCKHQWIHLNKLKIRFTYNFFYCHVSASREYSLWHQPGCHKKASTSAGKMMRLKSLDFTAQQWAILCLMQNSSVQHSKARNNTEAWEIYLPNFYWFFFSFLLIF